MYCITVYNVSPGTVKSPPKLNPFVCNECSDDGDNLDEWSFLDSESSSDKDFVPGSPNSDSSAIEVDPPVLPVDEEEVCTLTA